MVTNIQALREEKGWSTAQLAVKAGISQRTVELIEAGSTQKTQDRVALGLVKALGASRKELFNEKGIAR